MACGTYDTSIEALFAGEFNYTTDTYRVMLVSSAYTFSAAHEFLGDVPGGAQLTSEQLSNVAIVNRAFDADDVIFTSFASGTANAYIIYRSVGAVGVHRLMFYTSDPVQFPLLGDGVNVELTFDTGVNRIFSL